MKKGKVDDGGEVERLGKMIVKLLDHPLKSLGSCCESIFARIAELYTPEQRVAELGRCRGRPETKSKFIIFSTLLNYMSTEEFLSQYPDIFSPCDHQQVLSRYVLVFVVSLLTKLRGESKGEKEWLERWVPQFLVSITTPNEVMKRLLLDRILPQVIDFAPNCRLPPGRRGCPSQQH